MCSGGGRSKPFPLYQTVKKIAIDIMYLDYLLLNSQRRHSKYFTSIDRKTLQSNDLEVLRIPASREPPTYACPSM
jgi:hypothetical protein